MSSNALFGTLACLQDGESTSGRQLSDGCREAGRLATSLKSLEDQVQTLLIKMRDGHSHLVDVRKSVASTEAEACILSASNVGDRGYRKCPALLAEDLWVHPMRDDVWGSEGIEVLKR